MKYFFPLIKVCSTRLRYLAFLPINCYLAENKVFPASSTSNTARLIIWNNHLGSISTNTPKFIPSKDSWGEVTHHDMKKRSDGLVLPEGRDVPAPSATPGPGSSLLFWTQHKAGVCWPFFEPTRLSQRTQTQQCLLSQTLSRLANWVRTAPGMTKMWE